jgi:hypothetical protein
MNAEIGQMVELLEKLAEIPDRCQASADNQRLRVKMRERIHGLMTYHVAGRKLAAVTLPALGKTGWISVLNPKRGTSRGADRTRCASQAEALEHSREYALEIADRLADRLVKRELRRALSEFYTMLREL